MRIRVLGPLEVVGGDGATVSLPGSRERALLALLVAGYPRPVLGGTLVEDLWDGAPPPGAAATLRSYVSTLRRALHAGALDGVVVSGSGGYGLSPAAGEGCDARIFESLIRQAERLKASSEPRAHVDALRAALDLWRGAALVEVASTPTAAPYAAYLEEARLVAMEEWVEARLALGEHGALACELASLCGEWPLRERLWRARLVSLYRAGRPAEALAAYRQARARFIEELGIEPGEAMRALERAILRQDPALDPPRVSSAFRGGSHARLPPALHAARPGSFVGREGELQALEVSWTLAVGGRGQLLLVCGEPGIGKSALCGLFAERTRERGAVVLAGRCDPGIATPYQPFRDAIRPLLSPTGAGAPGAVPEGLEALFPELKAGGEEDRHTSAAQAPPPDPATARLALFDVASELILDAGAGAPVLLVLEDLHWADASSLLFLGHLARRGGPAAVLIVGTYRHTGEVPAGPLGDAVAELRRDPGVTELELGGLRERDIVSLVAGAAQASGQGAPRLGAMLHRATGGNPLFVRQMLAHLAVAPETFSTATGALRSDPPLPAGVRDVIAQRLATLGRETVEVLTLAAVIGGEFDLELLEESLGADALEALERAQRARLVVEVPGTGAERFRFVHDLVRQSLYGAHTRAQRARLHQRVGEAVERLTGGQPEALAALSEHFTATARRGRTSKAVAYALAAGRQALAQLAFAEAAVFAQRGLECLALEPDPDLVARCELQLLCAESQLLSREIAACKQAAADAGEDARALDSPDRLARAAIVGSQLNTVGQPSPRTDRLCRDALAALGKSDPAASARILAGWADYLASSVGDGPGAERLSARALRTARAAGDPVALARALFIHGEVLDYSPRVRERRALAEELLKLSRRRRDQPAEADAYHLRALARLQQGDLAGFDRDAARMERLRQRIDYWYTDMFALLWRGMRALLDGRLDDVERHAGELLAHARHEPNVVNLYVGQLIWLRRGQGRLGELRGVVADAIKHNPKVPSFRCAMAIIHADLGEHDLAAEQLAHLAPNRFAALPLDATWTTSLALLADVAASIGEQQQAPTLNALLAPYQGQLIVATKGMLCLGAVDRYRGMLAATTGDWSQADASFQAAILLEQQTGSPMLLRDTEASRDRMLRSARPGYVEN